MCASRHVDRMQAQQGCGLQVYKEYRNFMINKYREDVKRRLTSTECRKLLAGKTNLDAPACKPCQGSCVAPQLDAL